MNLPALLTWFETAPALRLLRSPNAPYILHFLDTAFKQPGRITVGYADLVADLAAYLDDLHETHPGVLTDKPESYLAAWCSNDSRWLHRFLDSDRDEPVFQLTPHTEEVFSFLDRALGQDLGFVGAESRLRLVIDTLGNLVVGASDDPQARLEHLRAEKQRIEEEIQLIESQGTVTPLRPVAVRERFATAVSLLKQLQGDFRAVEEKFRDIARQVQQRQSEGRDSCGGILEFALDAEDLLKREDQGVSFYEFVRFILSPAQQDKLQATLAQLGRIGDLAEHPEGLETFRRMIPLLLAEAEKVMRTNQQLSATLRRLLAARGRPDVQRVGRLCRDILGLAASRSGRKRPTIGVEVETRAAIASPFARAFWSEPPRFAFAELMEAGAEIRRTEAVHLFAQLRRLDWRRMRGTIEEAVGRHGTLTLGELLRESPPQAGAVEVLGYVQIAHDEGHIVSPAAEEEIVLPPAGPATRAHVLTVPLVRFVAP
jgi:hypothetical protein